MRYEIFRKEHGLKKFTSPEIFLLDITYCHHPIQNERFWGCSRILVGGAGGKRFLPHKMFHTLCNYETWYSYTLPKEDPKNI